MNDRIQAAVANAVKVRNMLKSFLEEIEPTQWFWQPGEGVNHVAWQVGHIAVAQHALCLKRVRGDSPNDAQVLPADFYERFGRGSEPVADPAANPTVDQLLASLDGVHAMVESELLQMSDADIDTPLEKPHPMFDTLLAGVEFAPQHELLHIGQIVLLRRLMGIKIKW